MNGVLRLNYPTFRNLRAAALGGGIFSLPGLALVLAGLTFVALNSDDPRRAVYKIVGAVILLALFDLVTVVSWSRQRGHVWHYGITDTEAVVHAPDREHHYRWDAVKSVNVTAAHWVLKLGWMRMRAIPRAAFSSADQARIDELFARPGSAVTP